MNASAPRAGAALAALLAVAACSAGIRAPATPPARPASVASPPPPSSVARVSLAPCRVPHVDEALFCADVPVPENRSVRDRAQTRTLHLHVVVLPALAGLGAGTPLFDLDGGPGIADTHAADLYAGELRPLRELGDVVLVDQRGTGASSPLACAALDDSPRTLYPDADVDACREALAAHADLRHYGSLDAAADLDDVRAALGYDALRIAAVSYGTQLAQVVLRSYPERVRAAFLMSPAPLDARIPREHAASGQRALDLLLSDCASDARCAASFPHLRDDLDAAVAREGAGFRDDVRHALYSPAAARGLPKQVHARATREVRDASPKPLDGSPPLAEAVYLSIVCTEDAPFIDAVKARRLSGATFFGTERLDVQLRACARWPRSELPLGFTDAVASDAPVLVVYGGRDPVTTPDWAARVTAKMPRARTVRVPWMAHLPDGLSHIECLDDLERAFFRDPRAPLDTTCVASMTPPPFVIE